MKEEIFWDRSEAEIFLKDHCPATGIILEGNNGIYPYWRVVW